MLDRRALVGIALLAGAALWINSIDEYARGGGISEVVESVTEAPPAYSISVLFIGNSYTFVHNLPKLLVDIASAEPHNNIKLAVQSVTHGDLGLPELWAEGNAVAAIQSRHWDYVVLQDQSLWATRLPSVEAGYRYSKLFAEVITRSGAKPLIYMTWARKPGSSAYETDSLRNPDYMFKRTVSRCDELSKKIDARVVPVGIYWQQALLQEPDLEFYARDGDHPSIAGTYLAAMTFYRTLTNHDITRIQFQPEGLLPADAERIRDIVAH